jgi:predicted RNase H-like nuclease
VFIGTDGCSTGWVTIAITDEGFAEARHFPDFAGLVNAYADAAVIGVDMPIGLVDDCPRRADQAARAFLSGQSSSVFNAPPRAVLAAKDYEDAQKRCRRATGKGFSKQSFAIVPKIIEVDAFVADPRVYEVHPEISFRLMNDGKRLAHRKKTWGGLQRRLALLATEGIELPRDLSDANHVGIDDVVDAAAAAWSARRIASGSARRFPADEPAEKDVSGREIAIWG